MVIPIIITAMLMSMIMFTIMGMGMTTDMATTMDSRRAEARVALTLNPAAVRAADPTAVDQALARVVKIRGS